MTRTNPPSHRACRTGLAFLAGLLAASCDRTSGQPARAAAEPAGQSPASAEVPAPEAPIRLRRDSDRSGALQAAVVSYRRADGASLDLMAVLHLADERYFQELERRFGGYDAVLYEMVKPERAAPVQRGGDNVLSMVQRGMCRALGLTFQLDAVDYGRANFVHADLTAEGFAQAWEDRNESIVKTLIKVMLAGGSMEGPQLTPAELLDIARSPDRKDRMKLVMAEVFANAESLAALGAPDAEGRDQSILIGERNLAALRVVERELGAGRRRLALLYGAGHVPDFDVRLTADHGFRRVGVEWLDAWRIGGTAAADPTPTGESR
ncbi:MAG: hypothetical protein IPM29_07705 [Planctomycetes bacterium]|nr:hypothetical protein [Planctomycetota bacterium]